MNIITEKLLTRLKEEINCKENQELFKKDILSPLIETILSELYGYIFGICALFLIMFLSIIIIFFLNIKIYLHT